MEPTTGSEEKTYQEAARYDITSAKSHHVTKNAKLQPSFWFSPRLPLLPTVLQLRTTLLLHSLLMFLFNNFLNCYYILDEIEASLSKAERIMHPLTITLLERVKIFNYLPLLSSTYIAMVHLFPSQARKN